MDVTAPAILLSIIAPGSTTAERPEILQTRVKKLQVQRKAKTAPKATLTIRNDDNLFPDNALFEVGAILVLSWGYFPARMTAPRRFVVQKWFPDVPDFKVEAHGESILLHKEQKVRHWENKRPSDVVREVAAEHFYGPGSQDIEDIGEVKPLINQCGWTDADLLRRICKKESKNGVEVVWYIDDTGFHFHAKRLGQKPRRVFVYVGPGAGDYLDYPKFEASVAQKPGSVTVSGVDPKTQKPVSATADDSTTAGRPALAPVQLVLDKKNGTKSYQQAAVQTAVVATSVKTVDEAKRLAGAIFARANTTPVKCTMKILGEPLLDVHSIIEQRGIGQRLSGLYEVTEIADDVSPGKFEQTVKCGRNGLTSGGGGGVVTKADVNKKTGPDPDKAGGDLEPALTIDKATGVNKTVWKTPGGKSS
ncbi:MAG: hypothetical protein EKK55_05955 [Rhodocyclaceae bacterium]|nr:MAG: hypothetical protein EKK55_05955 [Rhodocyclaceae bacterium]